MRRAVLCSQPTAEDVCSLPRDMCKKPELPPVCPSIKNGTNQGSSVDYTATINIVQFSFSHVNQARHRLPLTVRMRYQHDCLWKAAHSPAHSLFYSRRM